LIGDSPEKNQGSLPSSESEIDISLLYLSIFNSFSFLVGPGEGRTWGEIERKERERKRQTQSRGVRGGSGVRPWKLCLI
jgi:hypothetical protein